MKKLKWNRKLSILVLIMFITVTFASFNTNLFIDGKAYVRVDRDIRITDIHLLETEYNGYENTNSEYTNRTISTDVSLPRQASSLTYEVTISNVSDRRYKITDIIEDSYDNKDVKYELLDASIGNIIEPHTTKTFRVKFTNNTTVVEEDDVYQTLTYTFDYTGSVQEFVVPYDGTYTLEVWGAQGGSAGTIDGVTYTGGYGGYSKGKVQLKKNQKLYINVGGAGKCVLATTKENYSNGGYNGGGNGSGFASTVSTFYSSGGGGATHISTMKGQLSKLQNYADTIFIAAGGGGGNGYVQRGACVNSTNIPSGGGIEGASGNYNPNYTSTPHNGSGGTQTTGYAFGKGQDCDSNGVCDGGGAGFYGGYRGFQDAGGGSGYIGNSKLSDKEMYCYQCTESTDETTKTTATDNHSSTPTSNYAKEGNGYAKITLTRKIEDGSEYDFNYTGGEQTFNVPYTGVYKLEVWGAAASATGGYATGLINLGKETLYINVGGKGVHCSNYPTSLSGGGYNGGGKCYQKASGGSGATHIATKSGLLSSLESDKDKVLIVAGGAGGYDGISSGISSAPGSGGGFKGGDAYSTNDIQFSYGGTQLEGGTGSQNGSFGKGADHLNTSDSGGAGGGGWYGGGSSIQGGGSGSGGSGYIGNERLYNKIMYCNNCEESQDINTRTVVTNSYSTEPKSNAGKKENGYSRITLVQRTVNRTKLTLDFTFEEYVNGNEYTFGYTGSEQSFTIPKTGIYQIEVWGAQGATNEYTSFDNISGGFGGYSTGTVKLMKGEKVYITVGQYGKTNGSAFGGGGYGQLGGGGATHISFSQGTLASLEDDQDNLIIVAGGGGGNDTSAGLALSGGGFIGNNGYANTSSVLGGTQSPKETITINTGTFGMGGTSTTPVENSNDLGGGGGGGYYGGDGTPVGSGSGGGGSGYVGNSILNDKVMYCYECTESSNVNTKTVSTEDHSTDPISNYAKEGNGFAKITCLEEITDYSFEYTGDVQTFAAPYNGIYKVELWGASGGTYNETYYGGSGGYVSGNIELNKNSKLYLYLGGAGYCGLGEGPLITGGYNGGGDANFDAGTWPGRYFCSGGGASDIRTTKGEWDDFNSLKSRIIVAGAGGGGNYNGPNYNAHGGHGGGIIGIDSQGLNKSNPVSSTGGTQISGFKFGHGATLTCTTNGGGSGYYGGNSLSWAGGAGGSSYISGHPGCVSITENSTSENISFVNDSNEIACNDSESTGYNALGYNTDSTCSNHYSGYKFTNTIMIDGNGYSWDTNGQSNSIVGMPSPDGRTTMTGNIGNGYAKITLIEKIDNYNINYDLDGGTISKKRKTYAYYDDDITLKKPTKDGYDFVGWTGGKNLINETNYRESFTQKGITFVNNGDGSVSITGTAEETTSFPLITLTDVMQVGKEYYLYSSYPYNGSTFNISIHVKDNNTIDWIYPGHPVTFTEGKTAVLVFYIQAGKTVNAQNVRFMLTSEYEDNDYEAFDSTPIINKVIPSRTKGNRLYHAIWTPKYSIEYDLKGGTISNEVETYSAINDTFTLPQPTRTNYRFMGWTGGKNRFNYDLWYDNRIEWSNYVHSYQFNYNVKALISDIPSKNDFYSLSFSNSQTPSNYEVTTIKKLAIEVNPGETYTLSYNTNGVLNECFVFQYNQNCQKTTYLNKPATYDSRRVFTQTMVEGTKYYFMRFDNETYSTVMPEPLMVSNIQVEKGDRATTYEEYINTPNKNLTISKGSEGNRMYVANWKRELILDVNTWIEGQQVDASAYTGDKRGTLRFDVYINDVKVANQVFDYNQKRLEGEKYEIKNLTYDAEKYDLLVETSTHYAYPLSGYVPNISYLNINMELVDKAQ